jgi:chromosome segregation ATPase
MTGNELDELVLLKRRIEELINHFNRSKVELQNSLSENKKLIFELQKREETYSELEKKYERLKLSGAILGDEENSKDAKKRINSLVREIDGCIALLNNI